MARSKPTDLRVKPSGGRFARRPMTPRHLLKKGRQTHDNAEHRQGRGGASDKNTRAATSQHTLKCVETGSYVIAGADSHPIALAKLIRKSVKYTTSFSPDQELPPLLHLSSDHTLRVQLRNESLLVTIALLQAKLLAVGSPQDCCVLNIADGKNPGGSFKSGRLAREETLARSSTLYPSLTKDVGFYKYHKMMQADKRCMYSDYIIYSPNVVFFKDDAGTCINPTLTSVISCSPVNAGVALSGPAEVTEELIESVMRERMRRILHVCALRTHSNLILGAFGCGSFHNSPEMIAGIWRDLLTSEEFKGRFENVIFSLKGKSERGKKDIIPFEKVFNVECVNRHEGTMKAQKMTTRRRMKGD